MHELIPISKFNKELCHLESHTLIVEGVSGSGKTWLASAISKAQQRVIVSESEILMSWRHIQALIPSNVRLEVIKLLTEKMLSVAGTSVIYDRSVLSAALLEPSIKKLSPYAEHLDWLEKHAVVICVIRNCFDTPTHMERGEDWQSYLKWKIDRSNFDNIEDLLKNEQIRLLDEIISSGIPYMLVQGAN